jgi:sialate O-acetylesterase
MLQQCEPERGFSATQRMYSFLQMRTYLFAFVLLSFALRPALADANRPIEPSPLFSAGVVLQRDKPIPVWGVAVPEAKVEVRFREQSVSTVSDQTGRWIVTLQPEAAGGPDVLTFITEKGLIAVPDVMVGEVWLAAGQSNMFFKIKSMKPPFVPKHPTGNASVRFFSLSQRASDQPEAGVQGSWRIADEQNAKEMSAVGFFFANELQAKLGVPVGIVISSVGGTSIGAWSSAEGLASEPEADGGLLAEWKSTMEAYPEAQKTYESSLAAWETRRKEAEAAGAAFEQPKPKPPLGPDSFKRPMALFNGMINPLIPCAIRGVLWYQGESDATKVRAPRYGKLLRALIRDWRSRWGQPDLPFFIVQLPAFEQDEDWVAVQRAQQEAAEKMGSFLVTTLDLGEEKDVHPSNKAPVGVRLAKQALVEVYGEKMPAHPPRVSAVRREAREVLVTIGCDSGATLVFKEQDSPRGFEIAGPDGVFHPAVTRVDGSTIVASASEVESPTQIRYAGKAWPELGVFDSEGLPLGPFDLAVP